jgi:hypothetical protein
VEENKESTEQKEESEATAPHEVEDRGKYMLLNRLFKFIETEEPVNVVLAGYFEKLVISLRKRKEQQFVKFLFGSRPELLTDLMQHI